MYLNAIKINPNDSDMWNNLGNVYHDNLQNEVRAEKAYQRAIELH